MKKLILTICIAAQLIHPLSYPALNSQIVEIYDLAEDRIVYEQGAFDITAIASLTKIATTLTAIETIPDLDETVTVTKSILNTVYWDASVAGLRAGDRLTYRDLLYASMLPSGADATHTIAITSCGSIGAFVGKMNALAQRLGLENIRFVNVTGLDAEGHFSTADEVRRLLQYALEDPLFRQVFTTKDYTMSNGKTVRSTLYFYNADEDALSKILGSKSGHTGDAGYCLASLADINGHEMLIIVIRGERYGASFYNVIDTSELISFLDANFEDRLLLEKGVLVRIVPVSLSRTDAIEICSDRDIYKYLPSDYDFRGLTIEYEGLDELSYKNRPGDHIGTVSYYYEGELLCIQEAYLKQELAFSKAKFADEHLAQIGAIAVAFVCAAGLFAMLAGNLLTAALSALIKRRK